VDGDPPILTLVSCVDRDIAPVASWRGLAAWHRSVRDLCVARWSVFAPLGSGMLTALGTASAFTEKNWVAMAFFAVLTATFGIVGIRNFLTLNH
jgi:hypothetical protein